MNSTYLLINIGSIAIPLIFSFHPKLRFDKVWFAFWPAVLMVGGIFIAWDVLFTHWGVWGFNGRYLMGIDIFGLPIEEWMFFIAIPYACVFSYHSLKLIWPIDLPQNMRHVLSWSLIVALVFVSALNVGKLYTNTTFILLAVLLLYLELFDKPTWLGHFYLSWLVLLIPFFIVNGLLTGTGLQEEVVWYNNEENLGIRLLSIPLEDIFYGMLLILGIVVIFERRLSS